MSAAAVRTALVIGGTGRVGREVAAALAARGYDVAVHCHAALPRAREIAASLGGRSLAVTADLREDGAVRALVHRVADHFGRLDAVVHCARRRVATPLEEVTAADLRMHFDVNVAGAVVVAQEAVAVMAHQESGGTIVFVGPAVEAARSADVPYAASAGAVAGLARALAAELAAHGSRVRVACVEAVAGDPAAAAAAAVTEISRGTAAGGA